MTRPNVLFVMCDQLRYDAIACHGNIDGVYTPNLDRLAKRGITFNNGYSTCPVCVPARYTIRSGCDPLNTGYYSNSRSVLRNDKDKTVNARCGNYLPETMRQRGYRTFGIGKFHTAPWNEKLGYDYHAHSEELYRDPAQRAGDGFASFLTKNHPEFAHLETLMGERTEMYYMPQMSPLPAHLCVEAWAADRATEQLAVQDDRPYFGMVSFVGPHPPCAPPVPFNRMYDPDRMSNPLRGDIRIDHADEQIPWMNHIIWADDISDMQARALKARYYGEVSFIDQCLGRILDAVESRPDADNTLICFFSDHGDHLGDHHAWQKESFFEASCRVPFMVSWPAQLTANQQRDELVCLTDLFAIATGASGQAETRDGIDVLGILNQQQQLREAVIGIYGEPGTPQFKIMVRSDSWKYIYLANGGRELLFNMQIDRDELHNRVNFESDIAQSLRRHAIAALNHPYGQPALEGNNLKAYDFAARPLTRIHQFDRSQDITGFPAKPEEVLRDYSFSR